MPDAIHAGLNKKDIYDVSRNRFLTYEELTRKYGICMNALKYHSLIASIPNIWKDLGKHKVTGDSVRTGYEQLPTGVKLFKRVLENTATPERKSLGAIKTLQTVQLKCYGNMIYT